MSKINQQADLELVKDSGIIQISGIIKDYTISPFSVGVNNIAYLNRVELTVYVKFINSNFSEKTTCKNIKEAGFSITAEKHTECKCVEPEQCEDWGVKAGKNIEKVVFLNWGKK